MLIHRNLLRTILTLTLVAVLPAAVWAGVTVSDLAVTKTDGAATSSPGSAIVYTIVAANNGPNDATGASAVTVTDNFPAALSACTWTCSASAGSSCTAAGAGNIADSADLLNGGTATYTASCTIDPSATGTLDNTATVASANTDMNTANNTATDSNTLVPTSDLAVTKTDGAASSTPGAAIVYTIVATNNGPSNATGAAAVTVTDNFPAALSGCTWTCSASAGSSCTAAGAGNIADSADLISGGTATYTASCTIDAMATGTLDNTATVASTNNDPNNADNAATDSNTLVPASDLSVTKTDGAADSTPGTPVSYTIVATNNGPSDATGAAAVAVTDNFPAALSGCTWTCSASAGSSCTAAGAGNIADSADLISGGTATYSATCDISPSATGTLDNTATVASTNSDANTADNTATDSNTLSPMSDLTITMFFTPPDPSTGENFIATIMVANAGPSDATNVVVTTTIPGAITINGTTGCAEDPNGVPTCTLGTIPAGGSASFEIDLMAPAITGVYAISASVSADGTDPVSADNDVAAEISPLPVPPDIPIDGSALALLALLLAGAALSQTRRL